MKSLDQGRQASQQTKPIALSFFKEVKKSIQYTFGRLFQQDQDQLASNTLNKSDINEINQQIMEESNIQKFDQVTKTELPDDQWLVLKGQENEEFLNFNIQSLYQYGKLRQDSEQILPVVLQLKTNEYLYQLTNQEQALDIICMFDSSINNNELHMIEIKNALQILFNFLNISDRVALMTQNKILKSFENNLSIKEMKKLINNIQVEQKEFFKLNYLSQYSSQIIMTRKKKQNDVVLIILYSNENKVEPEILDWISQQNIIKNSYLLEFGNYQFKQNKYPNLSHTQISDTKILFSTFYEIFQNRQNACCLDIDIMIQGVYSDYIEQVKINQIYDEPNTYNNKPESHNQLTLMPFNTEFIYVIEVILPKSKQIQQEQQGSEETITGGEDDHKIRILTIEINYTYRKILYQIKKHLEIVLVGFQNDIPFNSLNCETAKLYYKQMAYNILKKIKQDQGQDETRELKKWILKQINKHQQIQQDLQQVIELVNKCN